MSRQLHVFRSPDRFLAGTLGLPGEREFYLQVADGRRVFTVACEKAQVRLLAEKLEALIAEVGRQFGAQAGDYASAGRDDLLQTPVDAEFQVGTMGLAWDKSDAQIIIELLALSEDEIGEDVVLADTDEGPDALRVFLSLGEAQRFAVNANRVVAAGRPPCPLCGNPLNREGHICPRLNGYHRGRLD